MLLRITTQPLWMVSNALAKGVRWAYHAVMPNIKRQNPTGVNRSEDEELTTSERAKLISGGRDIHRNFALVGWAVRKHLDYVSTFTFQGKMDDPVKNEQLEKFVAKWSQKENCDVAHRHDLRRFVRLAEQRRAVDGDVFVAMLAGSKRVHGKLQAIEGDRVRNGFLPDNVLPGEMVHGVQLDEFGAATGYALWRRASYGSWYPSGGTFAFERMLDARFVFHHAYWDRFDQTRGVSPLAAVYNALMDLYESFDYALSKMKVSQLLGLIITRAAAEEEIGQHEEVGPRSYNVRFGKDVFKLEMGAGDDAKFIEAKNPSSEFQAFAQTMVALVLKAFDIPYSFYAENFSNYSGSRQALLQYEQSADQRRAENRDLLNRVIAWRIQLAIEDADPDLAGISLDEVRWEWVAAALPWIDPVKEVSANSMAVDRGFASTPEVCKSQGKDAFQIAKEQADYEKKVGDYREGLGLPRLPASNPMTFAQLADMTKEGGADEPAKTTAAA